MPDWKRRLNEEYQQLKQRRDELRVQVDLGGKELRDAWSELDDKWEGLEGRMKQLGREAQDASDDVASAARLLIDEIREGFSKLRRAL